MGWKVESRGEDKGIETSLRVRPCCCCCCDPAPVLFDEASSSLISTRILPDECGCEDDDGESRGTEAEAGSPYVAVLDCAIIGWVLVGVRDACYEFRPSATKGVSADARVQCSIIAGFQRGGHSLVLA